MPAAGREHPSPPRSYHIESRGGDLFLKGVGSFPRAGRPASSRMFSGSHISEGQRRKTEAPSSFPAPIAFLPGIGVKKNLPKPAARPEPGILSFIFTGEKQPSTPYPPSLYGRRGPGRYCSGPSPAARPGPGKRSASRIGRFPFPGIPPPSHRRGQNRGNGPGSGAGYPGVSSRPKTWSEEPMNGVQMEARRVGADKAGIPAVFCHGRENRGGRESGAGPGPESVRIAHRAWMDPDRGGFQLLGSCSRLVLSFSNWACNPSNSPRLFSTTAGGALSRKDGFSSLPAS